MALRLVSPPEAAYMHRVKMRFGFSWIAGLTAVLLSCVPGAEAANVFEGKNRDIQLEAADLFKPDADLNKFADIAISNRADGAYCIVLTEPLADFPEDYALKEYMGTTLYMLSERLDQVSKTKTDLAKIQGQPAAQYVLKGVFKDGGFDVVYLITCIKGPKYLIQAYCWSEPAKWEKLKPIYEKMMESLQEF